MKNIITRALAMILCAGLILSFVACKKEDKKDQDNTAQQGQNENNIPDIFGNQDQQQNTPEPTPPAPDPVVPPAPEVVRSTAYDTRVTSDEIVLHNGISIGMSYDEVAAYSGYEGAKPEGTNIYGQSIYNQGDKTIQ